MTFDTAKVDSPDAREASMSRVQTQETVLASLVTPALVEAAKESQDPKPDDKPSDGEQKPKKTAQDRIIDLVNKNRDTSAKAAEAEERNQRLEAELTVLRAQAKPMEATNKPFRGQFSSEDDYIESLTDWKADNAVAKREQQQREAQVMAEQAEVATQWDKRQKEAIKSIDDYSEVVGTSEIRIPDHLVQAMLESEQGPEIAYYLALHPEEAKRISAMKPFAAFRRLTTLERDLSGIADEKPTTKPASDSPKKSRAPEPITQVKGIATSTAGPALTFEEHKRRRQAEKQR